VLANTTPERQRHQRSGDAHHLAVKVALESGHRQTEETGTSKRSYGKQNQYEHCFFLSLV
jgi:hypothetical protein